MKVIPFSKIHRTALVVDIRRGLGGGFEERVKRLFESVNGDNIKCDIFTLDGPEATLTLGTVLPSAATKATAAEVTLTKESPFSHEAAAAKPASEEALIAELDSLLGSRGYVQILHVRNLT